MSRKKVSTEKEDIEKKYKSSKDLASDLKKELKSEKVTKSKPQPNRIVLAGFMEFNEVTNYLSGEANVDFSEGIKSIHEEWQEKNTYMNTTLPNVDPYSVPGDMVVDLDASLSNYLKDIKKEVKFFPPYNDLEFDIKKLNIDNIISFQNNINLERIKGISKGLKPKMSDKELVDFCVNTDDYEIPIKKQTMVGTGLAGIATFTTENDDIRIRKVDYREVNVHEKDGQPETKTKAKALVLMLGLGDPFVMVHKIPNQIQIGSQQIINRDLYVLNNGFHRAYALKKAGYTHIPCIFSELNKSQIPLYLGNWRNLQKIVTYKRPPMFRDFFDPNLTIAKNAPPRKRLFKLNWNTEILPIFD